MPEREPEMRSRESDPTAFESAPAGAARAPLTRREREILRLLADGLSGAQIAEQLVLSPETVRTHVRNAMSKLGASTRSQAVAVALQRQELEGAGPARLEPGAGSRAPAGRAAVDPGPALAAMLSGVIALYDVSGGAVYLTDEDGLSLRRVNDSNEADTPMPDNVPLGDGVLGRAALERRAQLLQDPVSGGALIAAPMLGGGRLLGVIALSARVSRPIGRSELLLLQAFASRVAEVLVGGGDIEQRLTGALERFRASWAAATRVR